MPREEDPTPRVRSKTSKKKKSKVSSRSEDSPSFDSESDMSSKVKRKKKMSRISGDIDEEKAIEYDDDVNENTYNHKSPPRKKRDRKPTRNDEEHAAPYSVSNMGSSAVSSKKYSGRARSNGQPSFRSESHYDNRYIEYDHDDYMSEMGNHDPIDEYGQDYESEEDEEEPRFKYSTADLSDGDFRNQKCCLVGAGVFFILIAIAVSVLMHKLPKGDDDER